MEQPYAVVDDDVPMPGDAPAGSSTPEKRKRGRPRKDAATTAAAPGLDTPAPTVPRTRRTGKSKLEAECAMLIASINNVMVLVPPLRADALNELEMTLLTRATTAEAMSSERIAGWLTKAAGVSPHILMLQALAVIATPRLMRHGFIPGGAAMVAEMERAAAEAYAAANAAPDYAAAGSEAAAQVADAIDRAAA